MPTYQADAIVLRRLDYGEADRILTLLTREYGKLAAIAKGSRRAKTRSGSGLDLFTRSQMMLAKGRNLDVVAQSEQAMDNVEVLLGDAGAALSDVTKATLFVTDRAHLAGATEVVLHRLKGVRPAFSALVVKGLASPELLMEVDITADLADRAP